jgi:hypothetical protein
MTMKLTLETLTLSGIMLAMLILHIMVLTS